MDDKIKIKIDNEISQIDNNFESHSFLFDLYKSEEEPTVEIKDSACLFIHSFYNGIENIAKIILKNIGEDISNESQWHKNLFDRTFISTEIRPELFNNEYRDQLKKYLLFRHKVRHTYSDDIDWNDVKILINGVTKLWEKIKNDINNFVKDK